MNLECPINQHTTPNIHGISVKRCSEAEQTDYDYEQD